MVAGLAAVYEHIKLPQAADEGQGLAHGLLHAHHAAHHRQAVHTRLFVAQGAFYEWRVYAGQHLAPVFLHGYPAAPGPVGLGGQPRGEARHTAPAGAFAPPAPRLNAPVVRGGGLQRLAAVAYGDGVGRAYAPAVPHVALACGKPLLRVGHDHLVGGLLRAALLCLQLPAEVRLLRVDAQRVGLPLAGKPVDAVLRLGAIARHKCQGAQRRE